MKNQIIAEIKDYIKTYEERPSIATVWGEPLVGFAYAHHPDISELKTVVSPSHVLPCEVLKNATTIIAYFLPFTKALSLTNKGGTIASPEWAQTYEETNALFAELNTHMIEFLQNAGYAASVSPEATTFDRNTLKSNWSQRHIARIAGLGTFGFNNMLITEVGCCGRISSIITNLEISPDAPQTEDRCLYKRNGTCLACIKNCPSGALTSQNFDRKKCFATCQKNAALYKDFGNSYAANAGDETLDTGSEVCGKCVAGMPCAFLNHKKSG